MTQVKQLAALMETSLTAAFSNQELATDDQQQVIRLWQTLQSG